VAHAQGSIVTGGGSGIGRAISRRLARTGVVGVLDRDEVGAEETVRLIEAGGGRAVALPADVTSSESIQRAFAAFESWGGTVDIVVACAGVERIGTVITEPESDWDFQLGVNAKGVYLTARAAYQRFVHQKSGSLIIISSDAGVLGTSDFGIYTASKHAVVGLLKCLALDFGHLGIRANAVCPGNVRTPMMDAYLKENPAEEQYWMDAVPLRRMADPDEIADVVAFLGSPDAAYINGTTYVADGGGSAGSFIPDLDVANGVPA
jgi:NAD(P)-dependent dehydrogenase (short-subunit alcohol dehydrogenase family)